ncbi:cupin domain-containing protein [Mesorhizobium sp. M0644]
MIEGEYEFWLDGQFMVVPAGTSIFLPRGVPHTFRVVSAGPGRNLTILTPGGLEEFFVEAAARELRTPD